MNRTELTESQKAYRASILRIREAMPKPTQCLCNTCIEDCPLPGAAASLREVARLCMAEAARLDEEGPNG